jgi:hypothetical protein
MGKNSDEITFQIRIRNYSPREIDFDLEPYGERFKMKPRSIFTLLATGPKDDCLEVVYEENRIAVYGWTGSTISILKQETANE